MDTLLDIGTTLVGVRRAQGITQHDLGERVGASQQQIARWEAIVDELGTQQAPWKARAATRTHYFAGMRASTPTRAEGKDAGRVKP